MTCTQENNYQVQKDSIAGVGYLAMHAAGSGFGPCHSYCFSSLPGVIAEHLHKNQLTNQPTKTPIKQLVSKYEPFQSLYTFSN